MQPLEVACPTCAQQPGEPCMGMPALVYHAARLECAAFISNPTRQGEVSAEAFEEAVERSGLI